MLMGTQTGPQEQKNVPSGPHVTMSQKGPRNIFGGQKEHILEKEE